MPAYGPDGRTLVKGATITTTSSRPNYGTPWLQRRYGRSCDLSDRQLQDEDAKLLNNPIAQVRFKALNGKKKKSASFKLLQIPNSLVKKW
ncbi:unnamed protein product [Enterobius vermicularis]|uniref:Uncharacterized protein n=1 Tax=Enterobius vermicularis TaxID=51028 RepID=A0A0N4VJ74_ENTVE|nr:unnamed protein product [Enterobius vermicularis]